MIIASPWTRGGWVNSEVCDITSPIRFMEKFLSKKFGKKIEEPNISSWRRAVTGDLTSVFRPYNGETVRLPKWLDRNKHMQEIYNARFKALPDNYQKLSEAKARELAAAPSGVLPRQEVGTRPSNALKYDLSVDGRLSDNGKSFIIRFKSGKNIFGDGSLGAGFNVYAPGNFRNKETGRFEPVKSWSFAVKAGSELEYEWPVEAFEGEQYHLRVYGPNGFFREFRGQPGNNVQVSCTPVFKGGKASGKLDVTVESRGAQALKFRLVQNKYSKKESGFTLKPGSEKTISLNTQSAHGWYDFSILGEGTGDLLVRYAGRLETGADGISDPYMGGTLQ
jgi:phospholipase C